jgi:hypothetical protein
MHMLLYMTVSVLMLVLCAKNHSGWSRVWLCIVVYILVRDRIPVTFAILHSLIRAPLRYIFVPTVEKDHLLVICVGGHLFASPILVYTFNVTLERNKSSAVSDAVLSEQINLHKNVAYTRERLVIYFLILILETNSDLHSAHNFVRYNVQSCLLGCTAVHL